MDVNVTCLILWESSLHFGKDGHLTQGPRAHPLDGVVELSRVTVSLTTFKTLGHVTPSVISV